MNLRSQKGINIITLSVAIIILVLITSVLVYNSKDGVKIRNLKDLYNDVELLDNKIAAYYTEHGDIPKLKNSSNGENIKYENLGFLNDANYEEINPNNGDNYYIIDLEAMKGITLNYGKDYAIIKEDSATNLGELKDLYIINEVSHTIYYPRGINVQGINYYTYGEEWKKVDLGVIPIETAEQFAKIGSGDTIAVNGINYTFSLHGVYVLKNDMDLSSVCSSEKGSWKPIGITETNGTTEVNAFTGKLYGNGHEIRGLYINTTAGNQGLFGLNNGIIQDITVEGNITSTGNNIGGIVGRNNDGGTIKNCNTKVSITANSIIGGVTSVNLGKIYCCKNYGKIESNTGISTDATVGGIAGNNRGSVEKSYNKGNVVAKSSCIGGVVGLNNGVTNTCINNGIVASQESDVGGIVGNSNDSNAKLINSYNLKEIAGMSHVAGIIGNCNKGQVLNCYSIGSIRGANNINSVIGVKSATDTAARNCFYLSTLSTTDENATQKNMEEMKSQAMVDLLNTGQPDKPWVMDTNGINDGYPVLKWQMDELK